MHPATGIGQGKEERKRGRAGEFRHAKKMFADKHVWWYLTLFFFVFFSRFFTSKDIFNNFVLVPIDRIMFVLTFVYIFVGFFFLCTLFLDTWGLVLVKHL